MIVEYYLTAYPAVYGQYPQAMSQPIAAIPSSQREGKTKITTSHKKTLKKMIAKDEKIK